MQWGTWRPLLYLQWSNHLKLDFLEPIIDSLDIVLVLKIVKKNIYKKIKINLGLQNVNWQEKFHICILITISVERLPNGNIQLLNSSKLCSKVLVKIATFYETALWIWQFLTNKNMCYRYLCYEFKYENNTYVGKWQFLITFSAESNHKGEGRGSLKPPNRDYIIHGWSHMQ